MIYLFRPLGVGCPDFFSADILRTALARALVPFYPLAGRLGMAPDGRLEIDCSGQGAVFAVAQSDAVLEDLEGFAPSKAMCDMFVPPYEEVVGAGTPLLLLQVSLLIELGKHIIPFSHIEINRLLNTVIFWQ
jgi:shikimate O-hydroxycinnamoyltransferase